MPKLLDLPATVFMDPSIAADGAADQEKLGIGQYYYQNCFPMINMQQENGSKRVKSGNKRMYRYLVENQDGKEPIIKRKGPKIFHKME